MNLRRCVVVLAGASTVAASARGLGAPLDDPHIGGVAFVGPTTGGLPAIYWNPAVLGLTRGNQVTVAGTGVLSRVSVDRAPIDPATGAPGGSLDPGSSEATGFDHPIGWPPRSGGLIGLCTDFGGDRIALGVAVFSPSVEHGSFEPGAGGGQPTRYHRVEADLRHAALAPALSIRIGDFRVGVSTRILFSTAHLVFDEDTAIAAGTADPGCGGAPCGAENPQAAARYRVDSGFSPIHDPTVSYVVAGGLHYRRKRWDVAVSYASRPVGSGVDGVRVAAPRSSVDLPPRPPFGGGRLPCPDWQPGDCVSAELVYGLPDVLIAGVGFRPAEHWQIDAAARYLDFSLHDRIDVRFAGATLAASGLPRQVTLYRGFSDVLDVRLQAAFTPLPALRVGGAIRVETSAVPAAALNAGAIDGTKIEPAAMLETRLGFARVAAGYAIAIEPDVTGGTAFDPTAAAACETAGGDLRDPACQARLRGAARPTAAGTYGRTTQTFSLSLTAQF